MKENVLVVCKVLIYSTLYVLCVILTACCNFYGNDVVQSREVGYDVFMVTIDEAEEGLESC